MKQAVLSKKALKQAAASVRQSMLDSMPPPSQCTHEFPPEFQKRLEQQIARDRGWKKGYIVLAAIFGAFILAGVILAVVVANSPRIASDIQISTMKADLKMSSQLKLTANVGDETYVLKKGDDLTAVLDLDSWKKAREKEADESPLFTLNFGPGTHFTFYPDGYVYARYDGEVRSSYVSTQTYTQYQVSPELPQEILSYIVERGEFLPEGAELDPYLSVEECLWVLPRYIEVASMNELHVLSQERTTWAQYTEEHGIENIYLEWEWTVWVVQLEYPDGSDGTARAVAVLDAATGMPMEIHREDGSYILPPAIGNTEESGTFDSP